jgi:spectinomycin phosphotransferase
VLREDPGLDVGKISACLEAHYGLRVAYVAFLPVGFDPNTAAYEVVSREGEAYFLKVRFGPVDSSGLLVPQALIDLGVPNILAPLRTLSYGLWCPLDGYPGYGVVLYPFVRGESAMVVRHHRGVVGHAETRGPRGARRTGQDGRRFGSDSRGGPPQY